MNTNWNDDLLELTILLKRAKNHLKTILAAIAVGLAVGVTYLFLVQPQFTAKTTFIMDTATNRAGNVETLFLELDTHEELITSDQIVIEVIRRLDLLDTADFRAGSGKLDRFLTYLSLRNPTEDETKILLSSLPRARERLDAFRVGQTRLLRLTVTSSSPELSARVANAFSEVYIEFIENNGRFKSAEHTPEPVQIDATPPAEGFSGFSHAFSILEEATVPISKSSPNSKMAMTTFAAIGLLLGIALSVRSEWTRPNVFIPESEDPNVKILRYLKSIHPQSASIGDIALALDIPRSTVSFRMKKIRDLPKSPIESDGKRKCSHSGALAEHWKFR